MKRAKEILNSSLTYANIRLLGGFICLDTHFGCQAPCLYCLNRRDVKLADLLDHNICVDYSHIISLEDMAHIVKGLPSYKMKIPIRVGHLTDFLYEEEDIFRLIDLLDKDYPIVLMTRFPVSCSTRVRLKHYPNIIIHVSIAPKIRGAEDHYISMESIVESIADIEQQKILLMVRPLSFGVFDEAISLLNILPKHSNIALKPLSIDNICTASHLRTMPEEELNALCNIAQKRHTVFTMFGCLLRKNVKMAFFKFSELFNKDPLFCRQCSNFTICRNGKEACDDAIKNAVEQLHINIEKLLIEEDSIRIVTETPTSRAEEVYLSECFKIDIQFSSVKRLPTSSVAKMHEKILARWEETGFYPVRRMQDISSKVGSFITSQKS